MDKPKKISYQVPASHEAAARKLAKACGMSLSAYMRFWLKNHLQSKGAV